MTDMPILKLYEDMCVQKVFSEQLPKMHSLNVLLAEHFIHNINNMLMFMYYGHRIACINVNISMLMFQMKFYASKTYNK